MDEIRKVGYSAKLAKEAGWTITGPRSLIELPDRFELWDETKQSWIPLEKSKRKQSYTPADLSEWIAALNRMYGYSLDPPTKKPGRPRGESSKKFVVFMSESRRLAVDSGVSLNTAMERIAAKYGLSKSDFMAAKAAERRAK